jgi:hypothetical protein
VENIILLQVCKCTWWTLLSSCRHVSWTNDVSLVVNYETANQNITMALPTEISLLPCLQAISFRNNEVSPLIIIQSRMWIPA